MRNRIGESFWGRRECSSSHKVGLRRQLDVPMGVSSQQLDTRMVSQGEVQDGGIHLAKGNYFFNIIGFGEERETSRLLDAGGEPSLNFLLTQNKSA